MAICAQVGPRGGRCRRQAEKGPGGRPLDFCALHNQQVRDGHTVWCSRCADWDLTQMIDRIRHRWRTGCRLAPHSYPGPSTQAQNHPTRGGE